MIVKVISGNAKIRLGYKNGKDLSYAGTSSGYSGLGNYVGRIKAYTSLCGTEPEEHKHSLVRYEEVKATCTANGRKAHYECEVCGKSFADESATKELNESDLTLPAGHVFGKWQKEIPSTENGDGIKGHKDCAVCGKHFDKNGNEITDLKIPKKDAEQKPDDGKGDDKPDLTVKSGCGSRNEFLLPSVSVIALIAIKKRRRSS